MATSSPHTSVDSKLLEHRKLLHHVHPSRHANLRSIISIRAINPELDAYIALKLNGTVHAGLTRRQLPFFVAKLDQCGLYRKLKVIPSSVEEQEVPGLLLGFSGKAVCESKSSHLFSIIPWQRVADKVLESGQEDPNHSHSIS
jgi:hypothetical protein